MLDAVNDFFVRLKTGTEYLTYGRPILRGWITNHVSALPPGRIPKILDIGCGQGEDLAELRAGLHRDSEMHGIENYEPYRQACEKKGIRTCALNIERDALPFADHALDAVLINQVLEHTKDLFFIFSEISRVLPPGGLLAVGVPNLAAWHDRLLLALGRQPSGMKVLGPHVRGFTLQGFRAFAECDGFFKLEETKGSAFYPFPAGLSKVLAALFPTFSTAIFFKLRRTEKTGTFMEVLKSRRFETDYYQGAAA
jgi:SAM-dependent methyltransferase